MSFLYETYLNLSKSYNLKPFQISLTSLTPDEKVWYDPLDSKGSDSCWTPEIKTSGNLRKSIQLPSLDFTHIEDIVTIDSYAVTFVSPTIDGKIFIVNWKPGKTTLRNKDVSTDPSRIIQNFFFRSHCLKSLEVRGFVQWFLNLQVVVYEFYTFYLRWVPSYLQVGDFSSNLSNSLGNLLCGFSVHRLQSVIGRHGGQVFSFDLVEGFFVSVKSF